MNWNKRDLIVGIMFIIFDLFCLGFLIKGGISSYLVSALVVFTFAGVAFIKKARR